MRTLTATQSERRDGMWHFTCPLHDPILVFHEPSSMAIAIETLKIHMDSEHPGTKVRLQIRSHFTTHLTYSATDTVIPKGDLL